jgi:hypothetical protein
MSGRGMTPELSGERKARAARPDWHEPLRRAVANFVKPVVEAATRVPLPSRRVLIFEHGEGGSATGTAHSVLDPRSLWPSLSGGSVDAAVDAVMAVARSEVALSGILLSDAAGNAVSDASTERQILLNTLTAFLIDYLDRGTQPPAGWSPPRFRALYDKFAASLAAGHCQLTIWASIAGLNWAGPPQAFKFTPQCALLEPPIPWQVRLADVGGHEKCSEMSTKSAQVSGVSQP